jgi:hypothetical protein
LAEAFDELPLSVIHSSKTSTVAHTLQSAPNRNIGTRPEHDFVSEFAKHKGLHFPPLLLAMEVPPDLALVTRLDALIEPLGRLGNRWDAVGFSLPHTNHRNNQEDSRSSTEQRSPYRTVGYSANNTEKSLDYEDYDVQGKPLRGVKPNFQFLSGHQEQLN